MEHKQRTNNGLTLCRMYGMGRGRVRFQRFENVVILDCEY